MCGPATVGPGSVAVAATGGPVVENAQNIQNGQKVQRVWV